MKDQSKMVTPVSGTKKIVKERKALEVGDSITFKHKGSLK